MFTKLKTLLDKKYGKIALFAIYAPLLTLALEILNGMRLFHNIPALIFTILLITILYCFFYFIIGNAIISVTIVNLALFVIYILNYYRFILSSEPFRPADFFMAGKVGNILSLTTIPIKPESILSFICVALLTAAFCFFIGRMKTTPRFRIIGFSSALVIFLLVFVSNSYTKVFSGPIINDIALRYSNYGVALGFFMTTPIGGDRGGTVIAYEEDDFDIELPEFLQDAEYNEELMTQVVNYIEENYITESERSDIKPNVIVIMSEAFTDPTRWPTVKFSTDPVSNLHKLQKTAQTGRVITPAFGGSTCDPEYEFLTGNSFQFLKPGVTPYTMASTYINEVDERALANVFNQNGYKTIGLHTHDDNFYERKPIYPLLNFSEYLSPSEMPDATFKGCYAPDSYLISDEYFTDKIIETIENTDEPLFLYAISMQNHYPYCTGKYEKLDVNIKSNDLTETQKGYADAYLQGVYDADKQLGRLLDYLTDSKNPTVVFFFGDHQPILGEQKNEVFEKIGYLKDGAPVSWTFEEYVEMHSTPYVLWSNYELSNPNYPLGDMSTFFIGSTLLEVSGLNKNFYFEFLASAYTRFDAMMPGVFKTKEDKFSQNPAAKEKITLELFKWLEYDTVYGNKYVYERLCEVLE